MRLRCTLNICSGQPGQCMYMMHIVCMASWHALPLRLCQACHVVHRRASFSQATWCGHASLGCRDKARHAVNYCSLPVTVLVNHYGDWRAHNPAPALPPRPTAAARDAAHAAHGARTACQRHPSLQDAGALAALGEARALHREDPAGVTHPGRTSAWCSDPAMEHREAPGGERRAGPHN